MDITQLEKLSNTNPIILYDGHCILCNRFIHFVEKRDSQNQFRYLQLQNELSEQVKDKLDVAIEEDETAFLLYKSKYYDRSDVSFLTAKLIGFPFNLFGIFKLIPKRVRDKIYNWVANNRYSWFGKEDSCIIPDESLQSKMI